MNKINNRFNENENDILIINEPVKKIYVFNKLIKTNLIKYLILFSFIIIIFTIYLKIFSLRFSRINRNQLKEIINKQINFIANNYINILDKILADCRKEVILDNKMDEHEYEDNIDFSEYLSNIKTIAIYIPTFYYKNENNKLINESNLFWKNIKEAKPLFNNHYQPRKPIKEDKYLGYYNLNDNKVIEKQIKLAKNHGIYGFGIYYYWTDGQILYDFPLKLIVNIDIEFHFFLIWKNDYIINKKKKKFNKDNKELIEDIEKYIIDSKYIKINEKPVIGIYEPLKIKNLAREKGIGELFILANLNIYPFDNFKKYALNVFNGLYEFPPMNLFSNNLVKNQYFLYYSGLIYRGYNFSYNISYNISDNFPIYRGIMLIYDNSSISKDYFAIFNEYSTEKFYLLNKLLIDWTKSHYNESNQLLIINSWNNWNEGSYLEPDQKYGFANLNSLSKALFNLPFRKNKYNLFNLKINKNIAVQAHIFYEDLIFEIINITNNIPVKFDLYITITFSNLSSILEQYINNSKADNYYIKLVKNKGRDVFPFLAQLKMIVRNYKYICHIHSKKSMHSPLFGYNWRKYLFRNLLGNSHIISEILTDFENYDKLGFIFPENFYDCVSVALKLKDADRYYTNFVLNKIFPGYKIGETLDFPAGNMFWARVESIHQIFDQSFEDLIPEENNQLTGTILHGIERVWLYLVKLNGFYYKKIFKDI